MLLISLQAGREEFLEIDLAHVDPKACFKKLKGVGSSKLHVMTPVAPIVTIDTEDKRFVASYEVPRLKIGGGGGPQIPRRPVRRHTGSRRHCPSLGT